MVEEIVTLNNTPPSRLINFDETSVKLQNTHKKTLSPKGVKEVYVIDPNGPKENFTVGLAIAADGYKFPAVVTFKGNKKTRKLSQSIPEKLDIPQNVVVFSTTSGWWQSCLDIQWIESTFDEKEQGSYLSRDHAPAHLSYENRALLESKGMEQIFIPKGLTGKYQPLDVGVNYPLKCHLEQSYHQWRDNCTEVTKKGYLKKPYVRNPFILYLKPGIGSKLPL
ncbi:hypothetical protein RvY_10299 [Ramazzottius varieornatus]|uniref:DDE-1 domain-containing protein n=1 Tax=Ramazzottius varieornatus TaxID=947166 RepID=A0A1D1VK28_RAMVA|nr:hypothetical protein RvY_10299 [Ramazzottius varieornatus]